MALRRSGIAREIHNVDLDSSWFQELPLQSESPCVGQTLRFLASQCPFRPTLFINAPSKSLPLRLLLLLSRCGRCQASMLKHRESSRLCLVAIKFAEVVSLYYGCVPKIQEALPIMLNSSFRGSRLSTDHGSLRIHISLQSGFGNIAQDLMPWLVCRIWGRGVFSAF